METPDKIYVPNGKEAIQNGLYNTWFSTDEHDMPYAEYIRKEALMEWANGWLAFKRSGVVLDDGFSYAMEELIKKLNEM